jgi:hypothetical protein
MPSMKAVFVGKEAREIRDYEVPTPAAGEILIKSELPSPRFSRSRSTHFFRRDRCCRLLEPERLEE